MYKLTFLILFFITNLFANYEIFEDENIYTIKLKDTKFKEVLVNLKDEINFQSYVIVNELDLAKSISIIEDALKKEKVLKNGRNILICKTSFTFKMIQENIDNIMYCPLSISVYEKDSTVYISYKKSHPFKKDDQIAREINSNLKNLIKMSLE